MQTIKIKKGLNLPITGAPESTVSEGNRPRQVALLGSDYVGMKPTLAVAVGDRVKLGQVLFTDKKFPSICFTAPGSGKVVEINRGEKRVFESIVIELEGQEEITFPAYSDAELANLSRDQVVSPLCDSGLWTALRSRPFSKIANPQTVPHSIFVTAMDTNPLAPAIEKILEGKEQFFRLGLVVLSRLTEGKIYLCKASGSNVPAPDIASLSIVEFTGPHPAGNAGTHIHFLDPVSRNKSVWHAQAQDVVAIGALFATGKILVERVIALAGPAVKRPRLLKTRLGASITDLVKDELFEGDNRIISGSVLSGFAIHANNGYLGRYHQQISAVAEGRKREFLGWLTPGANLYSVKQILLSSLFPKKKFAFNTALHGGLRAIVPNGSYEKVMPLDILPTYLLKALAIQDVEEAEKLGCLELDEEDLALCTFVCPSKIDHGINLRATLNLIEKEG